ncbi:hypothetical protein [uncultured Subdoligranulum sp.]|uniref:hypothetical protein n=1 Tax=uncultured Subdoligranulum sp. TaxID=512298 RepID=UPI00260D6BA0|nr:hypothetical protein [uncultured Subdoligranulum sp.]
MGLMDAGGGLSGGKLALANATPGDVLAGKTFYSGEKDLKTGAMPDHGAWGTSIAPGGSVAIPSGYHNGAGKVSAAAVDGVVLMDSMIQRSTTFSGYYTGYSAFVVIIAKDYGGNDGNGVNQASVSPSSGRVASNIKLYTNDYDDGLYRAVGRVFLILGANSSGTTINGTIYTNQTNFGCHVTIIGIK